MTVRLLTNIGRLWTGSEVCSNAAILSQDERIAWAGPASELPTSIPGVIHNMKITRMQFRQQSALFQFA